MASNFVGLSAPSQSVSQSVRCQLQRCTVEAAAAAAAEEEAALADAMPDLKARLDAL